MHCFAKFIAARLTSISHAVNGLLYVVRTQTNARIHIFAAVIVILFGVAVDLSRHDWLWLITAITFVWIAETVNTAVEYLCDIVSPAHSDTVKRAKDISAGAVLLASIFAICIGVVLFLPHLSRG